MALTLLNSQLRGTRRIRLYFSEPLASGSFTSTLLYSVVSADNKGPSPINVEAIFAIASDTSQVELAVDSDFVGGGLYTIGCVSVPGIDSTTYTGTIQNRYGQPTTAAPDTEPETSDLSLLLYNRDIFWNGQDFQEDTSGDLATIAGRANWQGALSRRMISSGIMWDATYGAKSDQGVDAPVALQPSLAGRFLGQARLDNRTAQATIDFSDDPNTGIASFTIIVTGVDGLDRISVPAPIPMGTSY